MTVTPIPTLHTAADEVLATARTVDEAIEQLTARIAESDLLQREALARIGRSRSRWPDVNAELFAAAAADALADALERRRDQHPREAGE